MSVLRVGFDGRALVSPASGVRRYVNSLFGAITSMASAPEIISIGAPPGVAMPFRVKNTRVMSLLPTNLGWTTVSLPIGCKRAGVDLFHAPAYTAPIFGKQLVVLTIHDCSYERHPDWYPYRKDPLRRLFYRKCARAADVIITDSRFSKQEIIAAYEIEPDRISVIPLAAADVFCPVEKTGELHRSVVGPFLLHVGDLHIRRDLKTALIVLAEVRRLYRIPDLRLILVGRDGGAEDDLKHIAASLGVSDSVERRESISDTDLTTLYREAVAMIYPSRYEGFGLPLVEAMACGTPVIASRAGATPEVVENAAVLVEPGDIDGFARAVHRVLTDDEFRFERRQAALSRSSFFSWELTATRTVEVYRSVAKETGLSDVEIPE